MLYFTGALVSALAAEEQGGDAILATMPFRVVRVTLGFLVSSGLAVALQRLPSVRSHPHRFVGLALLGATLAGTVWYPSYRVVSHPWPPEGTGLLDLGCVVPCLLEHIWLMLTWSILFLAATERRPRPTAVGRRPHGGAPPADLRGGPAGVPALLRRDRHCCLHHPDVGDRPDPRPPRRPPCAAGPRWRRDPPINAGPPESRHVMRRAPVHKRHAAARQEALARSAITLYARRRVDPPRLKSLSRSTCA